MQYFFKNYNNSLKKLLSYRYFSPPRFVSHQPCYELKENTGISLNS